MRKIPIIFIILILFQFISAVEFEINDEFKQGETLLAKISGNFVDPPLQENIFFYRGHVRVSMNYDITKIQDEYYIYALLPEIQNNYTISIEDIQYYKGSQITDDKIQKNFTITSETADFSVNPGFVSTSGDFTIEVQNLQNEKITVKTNSNGEETSNQLKSGEIQNIKFSVEDFEKPSLRIVELSTDNLKYELPVYIFVNETQYEKKQKALKFEIIEPNISLSTGSEKTKIIYLKNTGEETLEDISIYLSESLEEYISLSTDKISELEEDESVKIELYISSDTDEKSLQGKIRAAHEDASTSSDLFLNFISGYVPSEEELESKSETCEELEGDICGLEEECDGESVYAKDGVCCLGNCKKPKETSTGKVIGWTLIILIIVFLLWFYLKRYKGAKR